MGFLRRSLIPRTGRKGQVNLNLFTSEIDFPFINMAKTFSPFDCSGNSQDKYPFYDADGYPTGYPTGSTLWQSFGSVYYTGVYATFTGSISGTTLTVSGGVTGSALAIGQTVRGTGITAGTRIVSGSGSSWQVSQSMSSTGSITITATIPWVLDWTGSATLSAGFATNTGILSSVDAVTISSTRIEYHHVPYAGAVVTGSSTGSTLNVTGFSSGSALPTFLFPITGLGIPPYSKLESIAGNTGTGDYTLRPLENRTLSYNTSGPYTVPAPVLGDAIAASIAITAITTTPGNIRLYRQDQEALQTAGQLCAPHFISFYSKFGRIRFLNWAQTNGNMQGQWIQRTLTSQFSWLASGVISALYGGAATKSNNDYSAPNAVSYTDTSGVTQTSGSTWTDKMMFQTTVTANPTYKNITGFTNANPAKVTAVGHGFSTGDKVIFPLGELPGNIEGNINYGLNANQKIAKTQYTITVVDADNFTLDGVNSTSWDTYTSGGKVGLQIRFKTGSLPYKTIIGQPMQSLFSYTDLTANGGLITLIYDADLDVLIMQTPDRLGRGLPIEAACQICNECGADMWLSMPMLATDNFVTQYATTIKANLSTKWCFELSNEVWNDAPGFSQTNYARYKPYAQFGFPAFPDNAQALYEWYGYRFGQMCGLINAVYSGGDHSRCIRIFGFKTDDGTAAPFANVWRTDAPTIAPASIPASFADEFCCDTYLGITHNNPPTGGGGDFANQSLAAQAIGTYQQGILTSNSTMIATAMTMADTAFQSITSDVTDRWSYFSDFSTSYGVSLCAYEGGFSVLPNAWYGGDNKAISPASYLGVPFNELDQLALWTAYQASSEYGVSYTALLNLWNSFGGTYFSQFQSIQNAPGSGSMWSMKYPNIFGPTNAGETAFNAYNAS